MDFIVHSHRYGEELLKVKWTQQWDEVQKVLTDITDDDIKQRFTHIGTGMSLSATINNIIKDQMVHLGWKSEVAIFGDPYYKSKEASRWRLDFAKDDISVEVAFNHGEAIAWNLLKPVLASELNHVKKELQTKIGIVILATDELKEAGAFDSAVGSFEKAIGYLKPLNDLLTVPMVLIGLKAPKTFKIEKQKVSGRHKGVIQVL